MAYVKIDNTYIPILERKPSAIFYEKMLNRYLVIWDKDTPYEVRDFISVDDFKKGFEIVATIE